MTEPWKDPIVEEIRKIRDEHAARFNYDLDAIFEDIKRSERESGRTFASPPPAPRKPVSPVELKTTEKNPTEYEPAVAEEPVGTAP